MFDNKVLLVPTSPKTHPYIQENFLNPGLYSLIVEREMISYNSDDCNRIGTGYRAF